MNEQQLEQALQRLDKDMQPEHDLWPAIAAKLAPHAGMTCQAAPPAHSPQPRLWHLASAAALVLVALLSWQLAMVPAPAERGAAIPSAELILLQVYEQQKAWQLAQIGAIAEGFDNWQQQLTIWDQAIAQVRRALQMYPDEPQLLAQLQLLYQQQLAYIERATLRQPLAIS